MSGEMVQLRIRRSEPGHASVRWQTFEVPLEYRATILDALFFVLRERDGSLAFRCACRAAMCGSCAMIVNGSERLACKTALTDVANGRPVRVEPLRNLPVVKDLVVDLDPLFDKYAAIVPWLRIDPRAHEPAVIPASDTRPACRSARASTASAAARVTPPARWSRQTPTISMQLLRAFNVLADERGQPTAEPGLDEVFGGHGVWRCHGISECTRVCPKDLNRALAIRRLKREALLDAFG